MRPHIVRRITGVLWLCLAGPTFGQNAPSVAVITSVLSTLLPAPTVPLTVTAASTSYATAGDTTEALASSSGTIFVSVAADQSNPYLVGGGQSGVQVFTSNGGVLTQSGCGVQGVYVLNDSTSEMSLLPNGTDLAVANQNLGVTFLNVAAVKSCNATGFTVSQQPAGGGGSGTLGVAITSDGQYAFVDNETGYPPGASSTTSGFIGIVQLSYKPNGELKSGKLVGNIVTGGSTLAGTTLSPDGKRLYVTSEKPALFVGASGGSNPLLNGNNGHCSNGSNSPSGLLTVIDVAQAIAATAGGTPTSPPVLLSPPAPAILATVNAGCDPVRMTESADQTTLWVAVREDNRILAFNTGELESDPDNALVGYAPSGGTAPVGIRLFHGDQLLAVSNSNRLNASGGVANLAIFNVSNPAACVPTLASACPWVPLITLLPATASGAPAVFPRDITVGPDDATLYWTIFGSEEYYMNGSGITMTGPPALQVVSTTVTTN